MGKDGLRRMNNQVQKKRVIRNITKVDKTYTSVDGKPENTEVPECDYVYFT